MTRTATTRSAWGTWIGFESCPTLLGRLVEGFAGPWIPLEDVPVPVPVVSVASAVPASDADTARDGTLDAAPDGALDAAPDTTRDAARDAARNVTRDAAPGGTGAIGCVLLAARSPADLRRAVPLRGLLPTATRVRIAVADVPSWAAQPLPVAAPGACWRHLTEMRVTRRGRGWHLDAAFSEPVPASVTSWPTSRTACSADARRPLPWRGWRAASRPTGGPAIPTSRCRRPAGRCRTVATPPAATCRCVRRTAPSSPALRSRALRLPALGSRALRL